MSLTPATAAPPIAVNCEGVGVLSDRSMLLVTLMSLSSTALESRALAVSESFASSNGPAHQCTPISSSHEDGAHLQIIIKHHIQLLPMLHAPVKVAAFTVNAMVPCSSTHPNGTCQLSFSQLICSLVVACITARNGCGCISTVCILAPPT